MPQDSVLKPAGESSETGVAMAGHGAESSPPARRRPRLAIVGSGPIPDPDNDLAALAAAGDRVAFEHLLRAHYDRMHRVAWRLTGSKEDAEDIVQEVCCGLVDRIGGFRGEARFATWLFGIVVNACHDHHRRRGVAARVKDGFAVLSALRRQPDGRDLYRRTWLASALGRLDPALRATLALVVGEGFTHAEAATALGIAEATVSWRMHEVRRRLGESFNLGDV